MSLFNWSVRITCEASWRCKALAASGSRFHSCNACAFAISSPRFRYKYHAWTVQCSRTHCIISIDLFDAKTCLLKQQFCFTALEEIEIGCHYRALNRATLHMTVIEMGEFQQVASM